MVIKSVSPTPTANSAQFIMDVYGAGFVSKSQVLITNVSDSTSPFVATTFVDSGHLTAVVPANFFPTPGAGVIIYVYLANPPNCTNQYCDLGEWSNAYTVQVQAES